MAEASPRHSLRAGLLPATVSAGDDGLAVAASDGSRSTLAYDDRLFVYSEAQAAIYPLRSAEQARRYLLLHRARAGTCPAPS